MSILTLKYLTKSQLLKIEQGIKKSKNMISFVELKIEN